MTFKTFRRLFMPYFLVEKNRNKIETSVVPDLYNGAGKVLIWAYIFWEKEQELYPIIKNDSSEANIYWDEFDYMLPVQVYVNDHIKDANFEVAARRFALYTDEKIKINDELLARYEIVFVTEEYTGNSTHNVVNLIKIGKTLDEYLGEYLKQND